MTDTVTGTGAPAPTHTVTLSWNASTSANIAGYNIYRAVYGTSCGTYSKINQTLETATTYVDSNVVNGAKYCYATTAVDSSSAESGYSNMVSNVQIPTT
jgi:fibronectin type 3 domain-containing protein